MARARRRPRQTELAFRTWGGRRPGAGRKRRPENVGLLPHVARPSFDRHVPVHVTMRALDDVPYFRAQRAATIFLREIARVSTKGFRLLHYSIQANHLHVIAEAEDGVALSRGVQRLASRVARQLNRLVGRKGRVWRDRYHRRDLATPRQYRNALVYVVFNDRRHASGAERARRARSLDGLSSAIWNEHWDCDAVLRARIRGERAGPRAVARPVTWIASRGWHERHGALEPDEMPVAAG